VIYLSISRGLIGSMDTVTRGGGEKKSEERRTRRKAIP